MASDGGLALVGPNCIGYSNHVDGLMVHMLFARKAGRFSPGDAPRVAFVGQSGGLLGHFQRAAAARAMPMSYVVSTGNEAGLDLADFTEYLVGDQATRVIVLYAEQIRRPTEFLAACERARIAGKPVVLMHPGRGVGARQAASSHTGALVGDFGAMRTQVEHAGALLVDTLDELMDVTEFLVHYPKPPTKGPALLTASGAFCCIASDFADSIGLEIPQLSAHTKEALKAALPFFGTPSNPLDVTAGNSAAIPALCKALLDEPNCGSFFVSFPLDGKPGMIRLQGILKGIEGSEKPIVTAALGDTSPIDEDIATLAKERGLIFSRSSDRCLRAIAMVTAYGRALESRRQEGEAALPTAITGLPHLAKGTQPEWLGKKVLAAAGIRVPEGTLACSADEAAGIAARIGYPVVMKAQAAALAHKTEAGGVILGIANEAALRQAWIKLGENVSRAQPGVALDGMLVEAMAPRGLELMIGAKRDPAWGPVLLLGLGGIWVEALGDVRLVSPTASRQTIVDELLRLRSAKLLRGFRGSPPADLEAVADAAAAIGRLMLSVPAITEIDVNPLVAYAKGEGVTALDALIVIDGTVQ